MIRFTRSHVQPIGLDLGGDSIKLLQVEVVGNALAVIAAARQPLPDEARAATTWQQRLAVSVDCVRQMLRQGSFVGRSVVTSLPREIVHIKNLRMPMMPPTELAAAVQFEARNVFASFDTEAAHVRHLPAGEVRQGTDVKQEVILLAAPHADVNEFLEHLHHAGLVVESLDAEPCALYRGVERFIRRREDEQDVYVLVDVGARRTHVVIGRGRDVSFYKPIEIGGNHLAQAVSAKLGITPDEARALRRRLCESTAEVPAFPTAADPAATDPMPDAGAAESMQCPGAGGRRDPVRQAVFDATRSLMEDLGREVSLCLRYFSVTFRGQRPNRVRLIGGESNDPQLKAVLNTALTIPVEPGRPLFSIDTSPMKPADRGGSMGEWALALGLGLKRTKGGFGPRDGKPRDPFAPHVIDTVASPAGAAPAAAIARREPAGAAEVVDLNAAMSAATPVMTSNPIPPEAIAAANAAANAGGAVANTGNSSGAARTSTGSVAPPREVARA